MELRTDRPDRREDGAVVVEFAIVFVLFVTLLAGLIQYGAIFAVQQALSHAAAEATRSAVDVPDDADAVGRATVVVDDNLAWLDDAGLSGTPSVVECDAIDPAYGSDTDCLVVDLAYDWENHAVVPTMFGVGTPDTLTARAVIVRD